MFAKDAAAQGRLKGQFKRHVVERVYWAVVYGHPEPPDGTWRDRLVWDQRALIQKETHPRDPKGMDAVSHYRRARAVRRRVAGRGPARNRQAESDPHSGAPARSHAGGGAAVCATGPTNSARFSSNGRRFTRTGWPSSTRRAGSCCGSKRPFPPDFDDLLTRLRVPRVVQTFGSAVSAGLKACTLRLSRGILDVWPHKRTRRIATSPG